MTKIVPVSRERHGSRSWRRSQGYGFAARDAVIPIVGAEVAKAAAAMPIGFIKTDPGFRLVALLSYKPDLNLFVGPDGRWLGDYVPAAYRAHPFRLLRQEGAQTLVLCVDEESPALAEGAGDTPFFDGEKLSAPLGQTFQFLQMIEQNRSATENAVTGLAEAGVIVPWKLTIGTGEQAKSVTGLYRVDEAALNALADDAFLKLRQAGSLALAYAQLLSTGQDRTIQRLIALHDRLTQAQASTPSLDARSWFNKDNDMIQF